MTQPSDVSQQPVVDPYAKFARYYDLEFDAFTDDLDFYRQFALQAKGPILELGCGSGRVLSALIDTGLPLAGVDSSPSMLALARERLREDVVLVRGEMEQISSLDGLANGPYWMVFCAVNTFLHLPDADAQLTTLTSLHRVVVPGGLLLLDLMVPDPQYLSELEGRFDHEFAIVLPNENRLDKFVRRSLDTGSQTIQTTVYFDEIDARTGFLTRSVDEYITRYIHRYELEHLLARCGWELVSLFGSYDLSPFDQTAERMLVLATRGSVTVGDDQD